MTESLPEPRPPVSLLQRRGIEAEVLIPLIRRLERELGEERAHQIAREEIAAIARHQGEVVAQALGRDPMEMIGVVVTKLPKKLSLSWLVEIACEGGV